MTAAAVSVLALAQAAHGQQAGAVAQPPAQPAQPAAQEGVQAFEPAFFARYNPVTALDMVRQLPGFTIDEGEDLRGFGATAGNVLIGGQRPATKTSLSDELGRIAARDVLRIEIIRASAAGDIDVRGYTELANVVLKPATQMQVSTTWAATTRAYEKGRQGFQIGGTRSWKTDNFGFRLNVQATSLGEREEVDSRSFSPTGVATSTQSEFYQQQLGELLITGAGNWTPTARDTLNLNFRVMPRLFTNNAAADVRLANGTPFAAIALDYEEKDVWYIDLGGDWEHKFSPANAIKLTSVNRLVKWKPDQILTQIPLLPPIPQVGSEQHDVSDNQAGEHVARGVWTLKPNTQHTIEFGLEGAYNYREVDRTSEIGFIGGPSIPLAVPVASTKVEEERVEASITDVWRMNQQLTLETGFNYESSTISQTISQPPSPDVERDFTYSKPRAVLTWTPTAKDQWRFSIVRDVSQLDFADFATGLDSISAEANVGNPNLEPEQTWKLNAQWKRPIGQRGSISLSAFYDDIEDTQDFIPVAVTCGSGICYRTAVGNVGDGERWGGRIETTLQLDGIGIKNGLLKLNAGAQESKVIDPVTGIEREISSEAEYDWSVDFRQDIPSWKVAWGGNYSSIGPTPFYRMDRIEVVDPEEGDLDLFIETTRFLGGALVRLTAANLFDPDKSVDRQKFLTTEATPGAAPLPDVTPRSVFTGTELRDSTFGRTLTLTIAGAF